MKTKLNDFEYEKAFKLISSYIRATIKIEEPINDYVPNSHIADVFKDVLRYLELENMYPNEFHNDHIEKGESWTKAKGTEYHERVKKSNYHILSRIGEYFDKDLLKENGKDEIHKVYQKLRIKDDYLRNLQKLVAIELRDTIMNDLVDRNLKADKIKTKWKKN